MSGIVGIYNLDGQPVEHSDLQKMVDILAHRGPDGAAVWSEGAIGLGHRMLWTTPESLLEKLPLVKGSLAITADARIDNREELIPELGLDGYPPEKITDSDIILAAYEKWGEQCPERLLGDFVFVIWDGNRQTLFCARDHFGVKPFYYFFSGKTFIFASEIKAIAVLSDVPPSLNEIKIADYLRSKFDDKTGTFYKNILRLPPAHSCVVNFNGLKMQSYWSLDPLRELQLDSDEEYAKAFLRIFTEAVRCRLRSAFPIGSMLSGGLDSSSVTCIARNLLLQRGASLSTFSAIFEHLTQCDERPYIHTVLSQGDLVPHFMIADQRSPLADIEQILWHEDEPFFAPNLSMSWGLYGTVKDRGVRIVLEGFDGDSTVSHGIGYLSILAREGRWLTLVTEIRGLAKTFQESPWELFWGYTWQYGVAPKMMKFRILRVTLRGLQAIIRRISSWRSPPNNYPTGRNILNADFLEWIDSVDCAVPSKPALPDSLNDERAAHYDILTAGLQPFAFEVFNKVAAAFSLETRYPFYDKRLVEFCLALPPEQKLNQGWSRMVMRRAMTGILPQEVQWRRDKLNFLPNVSQGLLTFEREYLDDLMLNRLGTIKRYVNLPALRELYFRFVDQGDRTTAKDMFSIWQIVTLGLWLQFRHSTQPVVKEVIEKS